ncbi:MAG TPA: hypothetical protein PLT65_00800 [Bacilli bacterium]|nr:hypothetical protein [Bacilli bacterium]
MDEKIDELEEYELSEITMKKDGYYVGNKKIMEEQFNIAFSRAEDKHFDKMYGLDTVPDEETEIENGL